MKKWLILAIVLLLAGVGALYGGYQWRQQHLSSGFRQIMLALFDLANTDADVHGYLHDARLAAKTPKDRYLLAQTETMMALRAQVAEKAATESQLESHTLFPELMALDAKIHDNFLKETKPYTDQANALEESIRSELRLPKGLPASPH